MGKNFESNLFKELCQLVGTYKSHMSPFHPQSDGQCEQQLKKILKVGHNACLHNFDGRVLHDYSQSDRYDA